MDREKLESINIINALRRGTVPASGLERIVVGLEIEEGVIGRQADYVAQRGGDTKFIRGEYGSGKTFLVARALEIARSKGFITSQVVISSQTPLHKSAGNLSADRFQPPVHRGRACLQDHHRQLAVRHRGPPYLGGGKRSRRCETPVCHRAGD